MINLHQIINFIRHFFTATRKGHGIHSPFVYELCEEVFYNDNAFYDFEALKNVRDELLKNEQTLGITDFGAGSKTFKSNLRRIKDIAQKGISTSAQSEILYKLINYLKCNTCIELGTSLGLNTLYLARAAKTGKVITIEGSKSLVDVASKLAQQQQLYNIDFVHAKFDEVLPAILNQEKQTDLLYIDGNHTYDATLNYFKMALLKKNNDMVIIFDDIYWSQGMTRAWNEIKKHTDVTLSIDAFYFGMVFFKKEVKEKIDLKIYL